MTSPEVNYANPVLTTLEQTGLDLSRTMLIGSGALALHEIRPARDVDVIIDPFYFEELFSVGQTPSGISLRLRSRDLIGSRMLSQREAPLDLPLDINTFAGKRGFDIFERYREASTFIFTSDLGDIACIKLADVLALKAKTLRLKGRRDARLVLKYLAEQD